jgi:hypothetical protein
MRTYAQILINYPKILNEKLRSVYTSNSLTNWQKYSLILYLILPTIFLVALVLGFALSVLFEGWNNFRYVSHFTPAPYERGDIIRHYR